MLVVPGTDSKVTTSDPKASTKASRYAMRSCTDDLETTLRLSPKTARDHRLGDVPGTEITYLRPRSMGLSLIGVRSMLTV